MGGRGGSVHRDVRHADHRGGAGQTRRIFIGSGGDTLLVVPSFDTVDTWVGPEAGDAYRIWCRRIRAITITQNVVFNAHALLNVNLWEGSRYINIGLLDASSYLKPGGVYRQFPWNVKTLVVGRTVYVGVWITGDAEPTYGVDGDQMATITIPEGFDEPGMSGLYVGHLAEADWVSFDNLSVLKL